MAGTTAEQQAILALRQEMDDTRNQLLQVSKNYDGLQQAHAQLKQEHTQLEQTAAGLLQNQQERVTELEKKIGQGQQRQQIELLDLKSMRPDKFNGEHAEGWRPWSKRMKAYCNGKAEGLRKALTWAEEQKLEIADASAMNWVMAGPADRQLYELLMSVLEGKAALIIDGHELEGRGFEVWRQLKVKYAPSGGLYEAQVTMNLIMPKKAKDLKSLGENIMKWENQVAKWELRNGEKFSNIFKIPALLQMIPTQHLEFIELQFAAELENYESLVKSIKAYSHHKGLERFARVDPDKMDLDNVELDAEQQVAYYRGENAGYAEEDEEQAFEHEYRDPVLCALFEKGRAKGRQQKGNRGGKGDRRQKGDWRGKGPGPNPGEGKPTGKGENQNKDNICHYCLKKGPLHCRMP